MSIKFGYSSEKTNSFRPTPWHWNTNPFSAFRGEGARHRGFLAVAREYAPNFLNAPSADGYNCSTMGFDPTTTKLIRTKEKNTLLLVTCSPEQDEQIMLITLRGGFRGSYSRIEVKGGEILASTSSNMHCCPTAHLIVRLTHPNGYVFAETGRRCSTGLVEIFSWAGYQTMPTEEFETWQASQSPDLTDATRADAKTKAEADRKAAVVKAREQKSAAEVEAKAKADAETARKTNAERAKPALVPRLEAVSRRREALGLGAVALKEFDWYVSGYVQQYTEEAVVRAEAGIVEAEAKHADKKAFEVAVEALKPRMDAAEIVYSMDHDRFTAHEKEGYSNSYSFNSDGLRQLVTFIETVEVKAKEEAAKAKADAEQQKLEAEAAATGLPSNVEIWKRRGGSTDAGDGWVIRPDGSLRERDQIDCPRPRYSDEGTQRWRQICAGEIVLKWSKAYTAAPHEFTVIHRPETLTDAQQRTVRLIQEELAKQWDGRSGMSGNTSSAPVGKGWGLNTPKPAPKSSAPATPIEPGKLDLSGLFGGAARVSSKRR